MHDAVSGSEQAGRKTRNPEAAALTPQARHFHEQAEAVRRIYAPFYPGKRIRIVLKALDHPAGDPGAVSVIDGDAGLSVVDDTYLGCADFGGTGKKNAIAATIVAGVPRPVRQTEVFPEKTAPDFSHKPMLQRLLWASPVLFEQLKYQYEARAERLCPTRHAFDPIRRATFHPAGSLTRARDTKKAPAILIGFHWLEMGGAENLAFNCVKWARAAGFRVLVVAEQPEIQRQAWKLPDDPEVEFIRADAYVHPGNWAAFLENIIRSENVRALHIHHNTRFYDNLMLLKAMFPDLVVIDSTHIIEYSNGGFPRTSGVWTNYIDHHHVISRDLVSFYLDRFGVSDRVVLGRMLDPVTPQQAAITPDLRLEAGQRRCRLVFVGRMVHQKRAPLVVEILRKLQGWAKGRGVTLQVDMVGTGAYLDVVRHMITKAKLEDVITLYPADTDVPALLDQADILLLPSSNEGLALVCYEAIEHGVLPISTDVGGQDELVPDSLLVPRSPLRCVRDTVALIGRLMTEPAFLETCKAETLANYRNLRADPTAEQALTALYGDIFKGLSDQ